MTDVVLNIFPPGSLASSVTTTVWVGITVAALLNLRLGWSMSGLVVPGYLVPLMIIKPWSAAVIVFEGALTYFVVLYLFNYLSRLGIWQSVFGRDRFFALLLLSVIIRVLFDTVLLPVLGEFLNQQFALKFDYRNHLHSFGLIIVALIANHFWKPGFFKGIPPLSVIIGLTYLIVRYVLMEYTNFSISNISYMYEDIAANMLASPKAYIVLLTTAFIASHMNLHYGWEYSGILIPSLIALLWYQPFKIFTTLMETFVIIFSAILVQRLPVLKKITIEGARKILLFFNLSYAYKFIIAYIILWFWPEKKITDYYGFGYLLPSLLAIKMIDKEIIIRTTRITVQTSLVAVVIASLIGFGLTLKTQLWVKPVPLEAAKAQKIKYREVSRLIDLIQQAKLDIYKKRADNEIIYPTPKILQAFKSGLKRINDHIQMYGTSNNDITHLKEAQWLFDQIDYQIEIINNRYLYLHEAGIIRGFGMFIIDMAVETGLVVEIPMPLQEKGVMEAGTWLFEDMRAKALSISGGIQKGFVSGDISDVLRSTQTLFQVFHKVMANRNVVQIRGYTPKSIRILSGLRPKPSQITLPKVKSALYIKNRLPRDLNLSSLSKFIGDYSIIWDSPDLFNIQRETTGSGFGEIYLNQEDIRKLFFKPMAKQYKVQVQSKNQRIDGYLQEWLLTGKEEIAPKGSNKYQIPEMETLLFFDKEIISPIIEIIRSRYENGRWKKEGQQELSAIASAATIVGYEIIQYHHIGTKMNYLILTESKSKASKKHWGTFIFRLGHANNYIVEIPRPISEISVFEFGASLFERLNAWILLISGAHKHANIDGSADIVKIQNMKNMFNLTQQVILRETYTEPMLIVQTRGIGQSEDQLLPDTDALIAAYNGGQSSDVLGILGKKMLGFLDKDGLSYKFVNGLQESAGYEVGFLSQSLYLDQTINKNLVILWLSPKTRAHHRQQAENFWQNAQFEALNVWVTEDYIQPVLNQPSIWQSLPLVGDNKDRDDALNTQAKLMADITAYIRHQDILKLLALIDKWPMYNFRRFIDKDSSQAFLMVYTDNAKLILVANLFPKKFKNHIHIKNPSKMDKNINQFITSRSAWLSYHVP